MEYVNFYENKKEAEMRLLSTLVLYDKEPYYVLTISDHKKDGILRVYMDKLKEDGLRIQKKGRVPYMDGGQSMDNWLSDNPDSGIIRKQMDSPLFNKYRPYPLGFCNLNGQAVYIERQPVRHTQQGLTDAMLSVKYLHDKGVYKPGVSVTRPEILAPILNQYPSFSECLKNLSNPEIENMSAAFHRDFAIMRGTLNILFLVYKSDIIGYLPENNVSKVVLGAQFKHLTEVTTGLNLFKFIDYK